MIEQQTVKRSEIRDRAARIRRRAPRLHIGHSVMVAGLHAVGLLGLWFWPRTVDVALFLLFYLISCFGITLGYHRLLTHRSYACPVWVRRALVWMGAAALQTGPARWVAVHRRHHQMTDREGDPHAPLMGLLHAHIGWAIRRDLVDEVDPHLLVPDVSGDDRWLRILDRKAFFMIPAVIAACLCYAVAGWPGVLWGGVIRTLALWHSTWCVNSVCHYWGSRPNANRDESGNVWWVGLLTLGEGWHNNHHARPRAALHGWQWYQVDMSGYVIRLMARLGIAWDVVPYALNFTDQPTGARLRRRTGDRP